MRSLCIAIGMEVSFSTHLDMVWWELVFGTDNDEGNPHKLRNTLLGLFRVATPLTLHFSANAKYTWEI